MAISAARDENRIPAILGTLDTDGITVTAIKADPNAHFLFVSNGTTGTSFSTKNAQRDANRVPVLMGVSSADGITPIYIAVNSSGQLLVKST